MLNVPLNDGGAAFYIEGVMGRVHGSRRDPWKDKNMVEIDQAKYSTSPTGEEETTLWLWASSDEYSGGGSGELSGDDLARFHGLVLPRSRGFGDKQPLERSWATSSVMKYGSDRSILVIEVEEEEEGGDDGKGMIAEMDDGCGTRRVMGVVVQQLEWWWCSNGAGGGIEAMVTTVE
ncbi:hypothetical protein Acr_00g0065300 [Actinidia rufa]|uniref:Uncharacterized protein n=1 Tax=Actinidia rufa TaxID=165716 RepID=A0A7J0DPS6_9ERIC|nr:hypothetical protein Acr_00g0065300 [Actinidia rufa]